MAIGRTAPGRTRTGRRGRRVGGVALAGALLATTAACGARWTDDERAAVYARSQSTGGTDQSEDTTGGSTDGASDTTVPGLSVGGGTTGGTTGGTGGTTTGGTGGPAGPRPCAARSTAPGVTDTTITLGTISTVSGPVPGLGEAAIAAVRSYVAYRNATGGVCGRKLAVKTGDDGAENGRFRALAQDMANTTLGIVGNFAAGDGGGVEVVTSNKVAAVVTAFSDAFQDAPTVFDINPPPPDLKAVIGKFRYLYDQGVRTAAIATLAQAQSIAQMDIQQSLMEAAGIKVVNRQELPLSTLSFDASARSVANSKADYFLFLGAGNLNTSMARSIKDTGYKLKFNEYLTAYGSTFIAVAGDAAEGASSWARSLPTEEASSNPELAAFVEWMGRIAPGISPDTIAADGWASTKAYVDALTALPGPITRDAVLAQLRATETYDGGGFFGPIKLAAKRSNNCYVAMVVSGGKWKRMTPDRGFIC